MDIYKRYKPLKTKKKGKYLLPNIMSRHVLLFFDKD